MIKAGLHGLAGYRVYIDLAAHRLQKKNAARVTFNDVVLGRGAKPLGSRAHPVSHRGGHTWSADRVSPGR